MSQIHGDFIADYIAYKTGVPRPPAPPRPYPWKDAVSLGLMAAAMLFFIVDIAAGKCVREDGAFCGKQYIPAYQVEEDVRHGKFTNREKVWHGPYYRIYASTPTLGQRTFQVEADVFGQWDGSPVTVRTWVGWVTHIKYDSWIGRRE